MNVVGGGLVMKVDGWSVMIFEYSGGNDGTRQMNQS